MAEKKNLTIEQQREMERLDQEGFEYFLRTQRSKLVVRDKGWDYKRKMIVILATMLLAAGRTALMLFNEALAATRQLINLGVSEGATQVYALIMAGLSLLAIEGYFVNRGIDCGKMVRNMVRKKELSIRERGTGMDKQKWCIYNFVEGVNLSLRDLAIREPSVAWIAGWNTYLLNGHPRNPFESTTTDYRDYEDGWAAAERVVKDRSGITTRIIAHGRREPW